MPELRTLTVATTALQRNDEVATGPATFASVESIDRKVKYVFVTVAGQAKPLRLEVDAQVTVRRLVKTDAEKAAERQEAMLQMLDRKERGVQERLAEVQAKIASELAQGQHVGYSRLDDLLEAQAIAKVWAKVTHVSQVQATRAVSFDEETGTWSVRHDTEVEAENDGRPSLTRLEALSYIQDRTREELFEYASFTSRSTSLASNLVEDYERQAGAKFASRGFSWF